MIFSIINDKMEDNFIIEAETIEECQAKTNDELAKRNWDMGDCYSMPVD